MNDLNTAIREHIEAIASTVDVDDITSNETTVAPTSSGTGGRRSLTLVAATVLVVGGGLVVLSTRSGNEQPASPPPDVASSQSDPTQSADTTLPSVTAASANVTVPAGASVATVFDLIDASADWIDLDDLNAAAASATVDVGPSGVESIEGFLRTGLTYEITTNESADDVIARMITTQSDALDDLALDTGAAALGLSAYELVVIASLIETETTVPDDMAKVARVIHNRLDRQMPLQLDTAVLYGHHQSNGDPNLAFREFRAIDTPWNTYTRSGLPATPITNPSPAAIRAALNPAPNPTPDDPLCHDQLEADSCAYLYFVVADQEGRFAFATTSEQHMANVDQASSNGLLLKP